MEEYSYYIAIDENGTPYIEHGIGDTARGAGQRATKYLMKIGEGAKARYLYTQQEVQAYMTRAQRAAQAQKNRLEREAAHRRAQMQAQKAQVAERTGNFVKKAGENLKSKSDNMREEFRKKKDEVRNAKLPDLGIAEAGIAARKNLKEAEREYESAKRSGERLQNRASEKMSERGRSAPVQDTQLYKKGADMKKYAQKDLENAQKRYDRSLLGRAENAAKKTGEAVKDTAKKAVDMVKDKAGVDERQRAEEAWSKVPKQVFSGDEKAVQAFKEATKAQDEYRNTPLGRAEYLSERAKEIATGVDGSAKDIAERAGNAVKSKAERMKEEFRKKKDEVVDKAKDIAGVDERERLRNAERDYRDARVEFQAKEKARQKAQENKTDFTDEEYSRKSEEASQARKNEKEASDNLGKAKRDYDKTALGVLDRIKPESKTKDVAETARTNGEKGQEQKKLESSRKEAENATKREDELFANLNRLAGEYEQKYGDNWKNRLSEDEERAYKIAENRFDGSLRMSKEKWDSYSKQVQDFEQKWNTKK